jgi:fucose permease
MDQYNSKTAIIAALCVLFLAVGMSQGSFGPLLPEVANQADSSLVDAGGIVTAIFIGVVTGQTLSSLLLKRLGFRIVMCGGILLYLVAMAVMGFSNSLQLILLSAVLNGFGVGAALLAGNVLAAEIGEGSGPLNLVNAMFGAGAILSPALISASLLTLGEGMPAIWMAPCVIMIAMVTIAVLSLPSTAHERDQVAQGGGLRAVIRSPILWIIALFVFCDTSIEVSLGTWLVKLLEGASGIPPAFGAMGVSWFWLQLTLSRVVFAWIGGSMSSSSVLRFCAALTGLGASSLVGATYFENDYAAAIGITFLGFGLGPCLAISIATARKLFPDNLGPATGLIAVTSNGGGAAMPFVLGHAIVGFGAIAGASVILALALGLVVFLIALENQVSKHHSQAFER